MNKIAIVTDSNSGITPKQAEELGIYIVPMPFTIGDETYYEDISLTQEDFYQKLCDGADIATSQPSVEDVLRLWNDLLGEYDEVLHIPMSSGLSGSYETAHMLSLDYNGRVRVVNNQRISVTQRQSVLDALALAGQGRTAGEIGAQLEAMKLQSSIYIMVDTLKYLKKGGRITPAVAALGTLLKVKPVLQIQGERLDTFAMARTVKKAKETMIKAVRRDIEERFGGFTADREVCLQVAHTNAAAEAQELRNEVAGAFPGYDIYVDRLSLSVSCHIGPGALAVACTKKLRI